MSQGTVLTTNNILGIKIELNHYSSGLLFRLRWNFD